MLHCTALALFIHTAHVFICREAQYSLAQLSSMRACTVVLSTEEAAYIAARGPEGLARASEARGSGSREKRENNG